jgi:hypothetical protein
MATGPGTRNAVEWLEHDIDGLINYKTTHVDHSFRADLYPG